MSKLKRGTIILVGVWLSAQSLFAQKIQIKISSTSDTAKKEVESFQDQIALDQFLLARKLERFSRGYLAYSVDSLVSEKADTLVVYEHHGSIYKWGKLKWKVNEGVLLKNGLDPSLLSGRVINLKQYLNATEKIVSYYENNGYPFVQLKLDSIKQNRDTLSGILSAKLGPRIVFDTLAIEGSATISKGYLMQYLGVEEGEPFNEKIYRAIDKKLKELPFARITGPSRVSFKSKKAIITLKLDKKSANFFNGVIGILPNSPQLIDANSGSNLLITGDLQLILINALKTGERVDISWKSLKPETQRLKAATAFPYLLNTPFGIEEKLDLFKQDTSFVNFSNNLGLLYSLSANNQIKLFWEYKRTNVLSNAKSGEFQQNISNSYGLELQLERLDYRYNPTKGVRLIASAQGGTRSIGGGEDGTVEVQYPVGDSNLVETSLIPDRSNLFKFYLTGEYYIPFLNVTTLKLASSSGYLFNPFLFDNDLERIGGFALLRGFDEQSLYVSLYSVFTIEYRLLLERNSYVGLFFDGAFTERSTFTLYEKDWPYGFGATISFQTKPGIFSIMYAVGSQKGNPVEFRSAKIHFGFVSLF